jgi:hypothetical protein
MNEQNGPLWRNGQIPTSNSESGGKPSPEQQAQKQNEKSAKHKRKH